MTCPVAVWIGCYVLIVAQETDCVSEADRVVKVALCLPLRHTVDLRPQNKPQTDKRVNADNQRQ